jgi:hypothetical protein
MSILCFRCPRCRGVWRVLPLALARRLWRAWETVEGETLGPPPHEEAPRVPRRTVRRWMARLASSALALAQVVATAAVLPLMPLVRDLGFRATRLAFVLGFAKAMAARVGQRLAAPAELIHRLAPGVRLM